MKQFWQRFQQWCRQDVESDIYRHTVAVLLQNAPPTYPDLRVFTCDEHSLPEVRAQIPNFPTLIESRILRGDLAILAATEREWVFRCIAVLGEQQYTVTGYPLTLSSREAYLEYTETAPAWRGKGVATGMLHHLAEILQARGIEALYFIVDAGNLASLRSLGKAGARCVGHLRCRRRFGRWQAHYTPAPSTGEAPFSQKVSGE